MFKKLLATIAILLMMAANLALTWWCVAPDFGPEYAIAVISAWLAFLAEVVLVMLAWGMACKLVDGSPTADQDAEHER